MIETLQGFLLFGSFIWFWIFVAIFIVLLFIADGAENGFIAFVGLLVYGCLLYFSSNIKILDYFSWGYLGLYLFIGLLYSLIRTFFYAREKGEDAKYHLREHVFRWWLMWPITLIIWVIGDLLEKAFNKVYNAIERLYDKVFQLGLKSK